MSLTRLASILFLCAALLLPTAALAVENCGNCVDDDADGLIDRKDLADCTPAADGLGQGIGDVARGKVLSTCAKTTQKAGVKFLLGVMKRFQKCTQAAAACIQAKPGDAACQAKATAVCAKNLEGFDALAAKLQAAVVAKCDPAGQSLADIVAFAGLGFAAEQTPCLQETGTPNLSSIANVASCIALQHFCRAQHLVAVGTPRARELLTFAGRLGSEFPCIDDLAAANGFGFGVAADHVKPLLKCGKTIDKLSVSLLASGAKTVQSCLDAGIACLQVKPTDPACLDKARAKCAKGFTKLQDPAKGTVTKFAAKFQKACSPQQNLDLSDIRQSNGIGLDVELPRCFALDAGDIIGCFGAQMFCEGGYVIERELPRARELAALLNVVLPGFTP